MSVTPGWGARDEDKWILTQGPASSRFVRILSQHIRWRVMRKAEDNRWPAPTCNHAHTEMCTPNRCVPKEKLCIVPTYRMWPFSSLSSFVWWCGDRGCNGLVMGLWWWGRVVMVVWWGCGSVVMGGICVSAGYQVSLPYDLRQGLSLNWKLTVLARLAGHRVLRVCLSRPTVLGS